MKKKALLILTLFLVGLAPAYAEDGARLFKRKGCYTCHGAAGANPIGPTYPVLAGQNAGYIFQQIKAFHGGHRSFLPANTSIEDRSGILNANQMVPFANSINKEGDEVIKKIASYLNKQTPVNHNEVDSELAAKGKVLFSERGCTGCHGEAGSAPIMDQYPRLAGLPPKYIEIQLKSFRKKTRSGTEYSDTMGPMAATLSEEESSAVANYLGSLR